MATNFPTSLDSLTNPTASDKLNSVTVPHASQHATLNDAVEALEAKVGVNGSAVTTSHDYLIDKQSVVPYDDASARTTAVPSPVEGQMSYLKDTNSVEVYDGSAWAAVGGGGKILQVVQQTRSTATSTTSGTYVSTGLTATITPTSATSTILVISHLPCRGNATTWAHTVYRGDVATGTQLTGVANGFGDHDAGRTVGIGLIVDSPATTSATTYTQAFVSSNADAFLSSLRMGSLTLMEISA